MYQYSIFLQNVKNCEWILDIFMMAKISFARKKNQCPSLQASKFSTLGFSMAIGCLILSKKAYNNLKIENWVQGCLLQPKYGLYEKKAYYLKKWPNESRRGPKWAQCSTVWGCPQFHSQDLKDNILNNGPIYFKEFKSL